MERRTCIYLAQGASDGERWEKRLAGRIQASSPGEMVDDILLWSRLAGGMLWRTTASCTAKVQVHELIAGTVSLFVPLARIGIDYRPIGRNARRTLRTLIEYDHAVYSMSIKQQLMLPL